MNKSKAKKILGAVLSSIIFGWFTLIFPIVISYFQFTESEKMPWGIYIFILLIFGVPAFGIGYNLVSRIIEICKGEEDEASKY